MKNNEEMEQKKLLWKQRILDAYHSDIGVLEWLRNNGIDYKNFYKWRRKLVVSGDISSDIFRRSDEKMQRNIELWKKRISDAQRSNLNQTQWCKQHCISIRVFQYWKLYIYGSSREKAKIWKEIILKAYNSKTSISKWCRTHNVNVGNFLRWKRILIQSGDLPYYMSSWRGHDKIYWKQIILEAYNSDSSVESWCKQHGICRRVLGAWKNMLIKSGDISPSDIGKLRNRVKEYWKRLVLEAYSSGLHIVDWCKQRHVNYSKLVAWKIKLLKAGEIPHTVSIRREIRHQDYWKPIVIEAYNSDISITDWCELHNVELTCFSKWTRKLIDSGEISGEMIEERKKFKQAYAKNNSREPIFCELPIPENMDSVEINDTSISKGTTFRVGKFTLSVEEDVSEDMLNAALEALNTVMEVFGND